MNLKCFFNKLIASVLAISISLTGTPVVSFSRTREFTGVDDTTSSYSTSQYGDLEIEVEDGIKYLKSSTDLDGESFYELLDDTEYEVRVFVTLKKNANFTRISDRDFNNQKYLVVKIKPKTPTEAMAEEEIVKWDDYLKDPLNFGKLCKARVIDLYDNRSFQIAIEDIYEIIKYYGRLRKLTESESCEVSFTTLHKTWDYRVQPVIHTGQYHDVEHFDDDGNYLYTSSEEIVDHNRKPTKEEAHLNGWHPEWLPSRPWMAETSSASYWDTEELVTTIRLADLMSETNEDGTNRWEVPYLFTLVTLAYIGAHNDTHWGEVSDGHLYDYKPGSADDYFISNDIVRKVLEAYNYKFDWHFVYEKPWEKYENYINRYFTEDFQLPKQSDLIIPASLSNEPSLASSRAGKMAPIRLKVEYEDMEKYSFIVEKAEIGKEVPEDPGEDALGTKAYIYKIPQNAPKTISNLWEFVEYNYEDIDVDEDGDYGKQKCVGRSRYINGGAWYKFMQQMCHNEFDWDEFEEILSEYTANEEALALFKTIKEAYKQNPSGEVMVVDNETTVATGEELPHLNVRLGKEIDMNAPISEWDDGLPPGYIDEDMGYSDNELVEKFIEYAKQFIDVPYVYGGYSPSGFDCGGFVYYSLNHSLYDTGYRLGARYLYGDVFGGNITTLIPNSSAQRGDLVFFKNTYEGGTKLFNGLTHVGIYLGDGKMLHAGDPIKIVSIETDYWQSHLLGFSRINYFVDGYH